MIISASRRTDIPAFYAKWFHHRIIEGYLTVPNPFNPHQVTRVSLRPQDVEVIVFWTRHPRPILPYLTDLTRRGYRFYFLYTILHNPRLIDPKSPPPRVAVDTLKRLSQIIGPDRVIWRYDPIILTTLTDLEFHIQAYARLAQELRTHTFRSVISTVDLYNKAKKRIQDMTKQGVCVRSFDELEPDRIGRFFQQLARLAQKNGMELTSCAEKLALRPYGIPAGKCIDDAYIKKVFDLDLADKKDPHQRPACGCIPSQDIGMYDSCLFGCRYCYATRSFDLSRKNYRQHQPHSPSMLGWHEVQKAPQLNLFDRRP
ncbi:MAG: DUF1848 domain-containing protein [Deltaproteobacteria bacterium]|nr:DUF1848 domain-containing protein [Deltaproteobacteria bacterium]